MDHDAHHALGEAEGAGGPLIVDRVDHLHLEEVISGAQRSQLPGAPLEGSLPDVFGLRPA